jgi:hypothetical protein
MIATLNVRGGNHERCEDSIYVHETEYAITGGVFDGCSTGKNSSWASQTLTHLFSFFLVPTSDYSCSEVIWKMKQIATILDIDQMHFLSTAILFRYDKFTEELIIRPFGDGFYYINDVEYEIEQDNKPDYIGYLVEEGKTAKEIGNYLSKYKSHLYQKVKSFRICSDGIKSIGRSQFLEPAKNPEPLSLLFHPPKSENYLQRMWNLLKRDGYVISDDLSIISYVQD